MEKQYDIPYGDIPKGIELALKNSDRLRADAEILAENKRYNSAIPLITLSVEEFGKALWLSEYFEKNIPVPHKVGVVIFNEHGPKIDRVLNFVKDIVKQRPLSTREQDKENFFHIPEEFDDQKFKNRMWYVGYQKKEENEYPEFPRKKLRWKNPLYVEELAFGEEYNAEFGILYYKYYDLWRCAYHGIRKFRSNPLYDKILNALSPEKLSFDQITSYIEKHFLLKDDVTGIAGDESEMDIYLSPTHSWITPNLAEKIKEHLQTKCHVKRVRVVLEPMY